MKRDFARNGGGEPASDPQVAVPDIEQGASRSERTANRAMNDEMELAPPADRAGETSDERRPAQQPFGDANNLNEIPRPRPEDPPYRDWWIDDDSSQDS